MVMSVTANDRLWTVLDNPGGTPSRRILGGDMKPYAKYPVILDQASAHRYRSNRTPWDEDAYAYQWNPNQGGRTTVLDTVPVESHCNRWIGGLVLVTAGSVLGAVIARKVFKV